MDRNSSVITVEDEKRVKSKEKFNKMIKARQTLQKKIDKRKGENDKDEGLLGISTMASTIE